MNHTFSPSRIMTDEEMATGKDYAVHVTSNEGKNKVHIMDCYHNALYKVMCCMNPNVHMIVIKEVDDKSYNGGLQRWDRERAVDGNHWEECEVDELITIGKIVEVIFIGNTGDDMSTVARKKAKHHWWSLLSHMERYTEYLKNDNSENRNDNSEIWRDPFILEDTYKEMALVQVLAEICDYNELNNQPTKFPFMKSGKNSKVTLTAITDYLDSDVSQDLALAAVMLKLEQAIKEICGEGKPEYIQSLKFSLAWKSIRYHWKDLVAF
ncbi:MAG: hypothetical protein J6N72_08600 [Psychrobacter sp.]|nr:hypothetical protein [Psychrobacter sp.]